MEEPTPVEGDALVLALVKNSELKSNISKEWSTQNIAIEWIENCLEKSPDKIDSCISKSLKKIVKRSKYYNKPLVVVSVKEYTSAVIRTINNQFNDEITAVVLLQPRINIKQYEKFNLPGKVIVISDLNDAKDAVVESNNFASSVRNDDHWVWFTMLDYGKRPLITHPVLPYILSFVYESNSEVPYYLEFDAESRWQHPKYNNEEFFIHKEFIESKSVDNDINRILKAFYAYEPRLLKQWPLKSYQAFNLLKYRDSLPVDKQGRYVSFQNRKGHKFYLDLDIYSQFGPEFVVAIDNENNLYRLTSFYITKQYYSWRKGGPNAGELYSQSMGAFVHFQKPLPAKYELPYLQYSSIMMDTIEFSNDDPYKTFDGLTEPSLHVLTMNCLPCHKVNGMGGAAFHLDYLTGKSKPGFAKPLLYYSEDVLNNFFFNQTATAKLIGVNPNYVDPVIGQELTNWILSRK